MLKEVQGSSLDPATLVKRLIEFSGFPEPFIEGDSTYSKLWRKSHLDRIIREDLLDLEKVRELKKIEWLVQLLSERVGSRISYSSLAKSLETSSHTVKHWLQILEDLYVVFKVLPFTRGTATSILKAPKYYFFDTTRVYGDKGAKLENLMACQLLAQVHFLEDTQGEKMDLNYLANKQNHEVDFAIVKNRKAKCLIEVKLSENEPSQSLRYFSEKLKPQDSFQVVYNLSREKHYETLKVVSIEKALDWWN